MSIVSWQLCSDEFTQKSCSMHKIQLELTEKSLALMEITDYVDSYLNDRIFPVKFHRTTVNDHNKINILYSM